MATRKVIFLCATPQQQHYGALGGREGSWVSEGDNSMCVFVYYVLWTGVYDEQKHVLYLNSQVFYLYTYYMCVYVYVYKHGHFCPCFHS